MATGMNGRQRTTTAGLEEEHMRDEGEHATLPSVAKDHDSEQLPKPGRRRDDLATPGGGDVNPGPPQRGYDEHPHADPRLRGVRDDQGQPDGGNVNPGPPQRGGG